ncbi:MAG: 16S rRNA (guanine(527)-N(7))-methyltransferase RsmG [Desulfobacteraceae bacterium]|nr:MAG: 16S rRNA (guanine(527)-N(7))-methyltransferase RsmG [Desulfobacteraceae bacterium]
MHIQSKQWKKSLSALCISFDLPFCQTLLDCLALYATELLAWNEKTNLTSITEASEVAEKHMLDSLIPGKYIQSELSGSEISLLDIGSGGGFPGIPLKIFLPHLHVTMIDSVRKKVNFLKYVIRTLNLNGIDAIHTRVEDLAGQKDFAGQFDVVISRAFTSLERFLALAIPFIKPDGMIIAMKGKDAQTELDKMISQKIGPERYQINNHQIAVHMEYYTLPTSGSARALVIAKKSSTD